MSRTFSTTVKNPRCPSRGKLFLASVLIACITCIVSTPLNLGESVVSTTCNTLEQVTLRNGSVVTLCGQDRESTIYLSGDSQPTTILAKASASEIDFPTAYKMITGYVCSIIYHQGKYGEDCYEEAETVALRSLMPKDDLDSSVFAPSTGSVVVPGQVGVCFYGTDRLTFSGLTPQAVLQATSIRNGLMEECDIREFTPRAFMGAMWCGLTLILPTLIGIGIAFAWAIGAAPYGLCGGGAANS